MQRRWINQYVVTLAGLALLGGVLLWMVRGTGNDEPPPATPAPVVATPAAEVTLAKSGKQGKRVCTTAQDRAPWRVRCPKRVPERTFPCVVDGATVQPGEAGCPVAPNVRPVEDADGAVRGFEFSYGEEGEGAMNRPARFFHFMVMDGSSDLATPGEVTRSFGKRRLGGVRGRLRLAGPDGLHSDHLWFTWKQKKQRYVVSLHTWDRLADAEALLADLVRSLRPPREL